MGTLQRKVFDDHPHIIGIGLTGLLSAFSLGPTPGMIPVIMTLSTLLVYSRKIFPTSAFHKRRNAVVLWTALTIGGSIPRFTTSIHALSQPILSILFLFMLSGITSALIVGLLFAETRAGNHYGAKYHTAGLLLFPALWATFWTTIAYLSPFGMLSTWSPVEGTGAYDWMLPYFGPESLNWVAAAWAVVISETLMSLYMGSKDGLHEDVYSNPGPLIPTTSESNGYHHHLHLSDAGENSENARSGTVKNDKTVLLGIALVLLTVPSYIFNSLPLPLGDVSKVTPFVVSCALPTVDEYKVPSFLFKHYLAESKRLDNTANFILWPEGAVRFESESERNLALREVRKELVHAFVGVSFEEVLADTENPNNRHGIRRNGIAIVSNKSTTPHILYYKRHLVPIAESFSLSGSREPPTVFNAEIRYNKHLPIVDHARNVSVTTSICLDFSDPSLFEGLEVRPELILAPARTWDVNVGYMMWKQASERAREVGSTLLWCDGGEGGVSGVASKGDEGVFQVGSGSWTRTIGVEYPSQTLDRTLYARFGNSVLLLFWALLVGVPVGQRGGRFVQFLIERFRQRRPFTTGPSLAVGSLIDADD